jgi:hypothetical protein
VVEAEGPTLYDVQAYRCCGGSLLFLYMANRNTNLSTKLKQQHGAADFTTFVSETTTWMDGKPCIKQSRTNSCCSTPPSISLTQYSSTITFIVWNPEHSSPLQLIERKGALTTPTTTTRLRIWLTGTRKTTQRQSN